jgi:hypothetical protein
MLNGARKNLSNLVLNFVTYLRDTTLLSQKYILSASGGLTPNYPPEYFGGLSSF